MLKELKKRIAEEQTAKENMSIEEMRHEQQLVDYKIKEITNDLDFNEWGSEVRKKEQVYKEEKYYAARRYVLSITCDDEDDSIPLGDIIARYSTSKAITPDLPIEEPNNSLNEHLDTTPTIENLVPIPSEFEGISDDTSDVPNCDNNRVNSEIDFVESLIDRDTSIVHSSKIDPILEEFSGELAHIAPIPLGIVEADFDPNDDTSSDDDSFENIEYVDASPSYYELVSLEKVYDVDQEEKEFDLEDIFQIHDVNLRERLLKISRLISNIESLKNNPTPDFVLNHHTEETRSGSTTTHANNSLPEYDSFLFEIEPDQGGLTSVVISDNSNEPLLELLEFESFHFNPSFPRPPPEPPDVKIFLHFEPDAPVIDNFNELNIEDDDSFTFVIRTFLPFLTYPEASPLSCSTGSEDTIFDPGIITFPFSYLQPEVYVAQPPRFIDFEKPDYVYKLKKALYGLKQAPKAWYDRLKAFLIKHEYKMGMVDNTLFTKKKSSNLIIVQIYVDDIIFGSTCQDMCDKFAKIMHDEFEMSMMGELNFFLGLQIKQMEDGIFFNQSKYIKEMLKKFGLEDSKPMKTPMSSDTKLTKDEECESVDSTKYRGMIGSLLYLTASRPDIMFSVCLCARFQEAPKTSHLEAVKRIFRYIKGTTHLGLWYPKGTGIETIVYADSDHAGDYVEIFFKLCNSPF
ncbi:retrovirus-related pol polyprotein from transposon TNT 1-94 [Tanacetum coccineum]